MQICSAKQRGRRTKIRSPTKEHCGDRTANQEQRLCRADTQPWYRRARPTSGEKQAATIKEEGCPSIPTRATGEHRATICAAGTDNQQTRWAGDHFRRPHMVTLCQNRQSRAKSCDSQGRKLHQAGTKSGTRDFTTCSVEQLGRWLLPPPTRGHALPELPTESQRLRQPRKRLYPLDNPSGSGHWT